MAPLKDVTTGRNRPEPFSDLDNDTMPAEAFDLWDEGAVDYVAHSSQQFAREVDGVDFGVDSDLVTLGCSVPNIWR
jgi:hypothetical protein